MPTIRIEIPANVASEQKSGSLTLEQLVDYVANAGNLFGARHGIKGHEDTFVLITIGGVSNKKVVFGTITLLATEYPGYVEYPGARENLLSEIAQYVQGHLEGMYGFRPGISFAFQLKEQFDQIEFEDPDRSRFMGVDWKKSAA